MDILGKIPWHLLKWKFRRLRRRLFTVPRPNTEDFVIEESPTEVERGLGGLSYGPHWELSYHYKGEVLNLARIVYEENNEYDIQWWQVHVRGWEGDDGRTELTAHWEPEPSEYPHAHYNSVGFDYHLGMKMLSDALAETDLNVVYDPTESYYQS